VGEAIINSPNARERIKEYYKKAVLLQENRAMPQLFMAVKLRKLGFKAIDIPAHNRI